MEPNKEVKAMEIPTIKEIPAKYAEAITEMSYRLLANATIEQLRAALVGLAGSFFDATAKGGEEDRKAWIMYMVYLALRRQRFAGMKPLNQEKH